MKIAIILLSILFQLSATILALRLISVTKRKAAWLFLAAGISLMTVRRIESLVDVLGTGANEPGLLFETVGLVLSILMFLGVYSIRPLFLEIINAEEIQRALNLRLFALSEEQQLLLDHSRDFIYRHDTDGVISYISPSVEKITGYSPAEWLGHYTRHYSGNPRNTVGIEATEAMLKTGRPTPPYRVEVAHKEGGTVWLEISKQPLIIDGKISGLIGVARDITPRVALEDEREKLITELQDAVANVKTLKGLLPICSSCKKVRDDRGYWQQIEAYVSEHSGAEFSHGICPDCAQKLYPGYTSKKRSDV